MAFNTMFFDRFMWNLQFGQTRIVPKARANGAPITGVTISAGVPEADEATELLAQLRADGFPYISFKPGTTKQIRDILAIADANPEHQLILQIEDGHAGGHHSWLDLDEMLIDTYAAAREHDNVTITVGGGIYSAERAAEYLTGTKPPPPRRSNSCSSTPRVSARIPMAVGSAAVAPTVVWLPGSRTCWRISTKSITPSPLPPG